MSEDIEVKKGEKKEEKKEEEQKSREIAVRRESPFSLFQEMDRMFEDMWKDFWPFSRRRRNFFEPIKWEERPIFRTPLSNITEDDDKFAITAEIPGLDKGDIEITLHDGTLEIKGEQEEEEEEEEEGYVRREYSSASYYRAFQLPENIDEDAIDAKLEKGVLNVTIPKKEPEEKEKKQIEVK